MNGTVREKLSPAESSFKGSCCEVHPGVDLANVEVSIISWIRITHVTCTEWRTQVSQCEGLCLYKSGTAEYDFVS